MGECSQVSNYEVAPFFDNFNDGDANGWTSWGGTWNATNGYLTKTAAGAATACHSQTSDDLEYRISYYADNTTSNELLAKISPRYEADGDKVSVVIREDRMYLEKRVSGQYTTLDVDVDADTADDTWYDVRIVCDGGDVEVWRAERGSMSTKVLEAKDVLRLLFGQNVRRV